tara:strand:- start:161 stop:1255 length:1095 start_codon:yes stop_codon:yes gene_type:complete
MTLKTIVNFIESKFPLALQEPYDNCGLTYGHPDAEIDGILVCLDVTEEVVAEAIQKKCNLIISHHPVIFQGLKNVTGKSMNQRVIESCIQKKIYLYALHTNLDNHYKGVNYQIANKIGLKNLKPLAPKKDTLMKLVVYVPEAQKENIDHALFQEGAGSIGNYSECSFNVKGKGSFTPNIEASPSFGEHEKNQSIDEIRAEYLVRHTDLKSVLNAMWKHHPYEEVAHDIVPIKNTNPEIGSGMMGEMNIAMDELDFLKKIKSDFGLSILRHSEFLKKPIKNVAICGGSGAFLLGSAKKSKADVFITSDFKYHEFFDAENQILILDIGHWESEQFTSILIRDFLNEKFSNFAIHLTEVNTNPVNYF